MLINQLAHRSGVSARALRHYDRLGLLSSRRLENGYRDFEEGAVEEVRRIRLLLDIGLGLQAAAQILPCFAADGALTACTEARERLRVQIRDVDSSLAELRRTRDLLAGTLDNLVESSPVG
jgi:DNA-binding transcriptional MerR regulator